MSAILVRCKKCRRPYANTADYCPDCGARSVRGTRGLIAKVASIVLAILALVATSALMVTQFRIHDKTADPNAAKTPLPAPEGGGGGDISFSSTQ